jgi:ribosome biogenesis protein Tsr3
MQFKHRHKFKACANKKLHKLRLSIKINTTEKVRKVLLD